MKSKLSAQSKVLMKASTWSRDSHGLFDYEADNVAEYRLRTTCPCKILRSGDQVQLATRSVEINELGSDYQLIAVLDSLSQGHFSLKSDNNDLWIVVRSLPQEEYAITVGDIIKLGRVCYQVKQLSMNEVEARQPFADSQCRICLCDGDSEENPLVAPCKCRGGVEYIHYKCLRHWLETRTSHSNQALFWRDLNCEICKTPFQLNLRGKCLINIDANSPHLILETVDRYQGTHAIMIQPDQVVKMGRGHDCDVRIPDISVSRCHAMISYREGKFWLKDNLSKFGTLVKVQNSLVLESKHTIQIGRTVLTLALDESIIQSIIQLGLIIY